MIPVGSGFSGGFSEGFGNSHITWLGVSGIPRSAYNFNIFADKVAAVEEESVTKGGFSTAGDVDRRLLRRLQIQQGIMKDDEEVIALLLAAGYLN